MKLLNDDLEASIAKVTSITSIRYKLLNSKEISTIHNLLLSEGIIWYYNSRAVDLGAYDFAIENLVGLQELFEGIFKYRETKDVKLTILYKRFVEVIIKRISSEEYN